MAVKAGSGGVAGDFGRGLSGLQIFARAAERVPVLRTGNPLIDRNRGEEQGKVERSGLGSLGSSATSDHGSQRTVIDLAAGAEARFYRVEIVLP